MVQVRSDVLFEKSLEILNRSMIANRTRAPYKGLFAACEKFFENWVLEVDIYDQDPNIYDEKYLIRLHRGIFEIMDALENKPSMTWKVSRRYLQHIADHPDEYIESPLKFDWVWLKDRIGFEI